MTLPDTIQLPIHGDRIKSGDPEQLDQYLHELVLKLQRMYEDIAYNVNGEIRADYFTTDRNWTPIIQDATNTGTTFTYTHQVGWALRRGIVVDVWFDVLWTAASGATGGNMLVQLPWKVAVTNEKPFVGTAQASGLTFTGGTDCIVNAKSNSYTAEIWNSGSGMTTLNQATQATGQIIGHVRYIGQNNEV